MNSSKAGEASPLVAVVGPTASGKSALAVTLAQSLDGEVVVCDSTQLYRHFDIGTAKTTPNQQRGIPHHLVDILEPHEVFTAGDYRRRALDVLSDLRHRSRLPILAVGTGLYLRALLEGLADAPGRSEYLRERLKRRSARRASAYLHRMLERLDPEAAARIAPRDTHKLIRAIEVSLLAGKPVSAVHSQGRAGLEGFRALKIGLLPLRLALYERIDRRVAQMMEGGWLEEVRRLLDAGIPESAKPFQFIGYGSLRAHLEGKIGLSEAIRAIQQATRHYAKRQITWFRKEPGVRWFGGFGDDPSLAATALEHLRRETDDAKRPRQQSNAGV